MGLVDLIAYCIVIVLVIFLVYKEHDHFVCDYLTCSAVGWSKIRTKTEKEQYIKMLEIETRQSIWMRAFIVSFIITVFVYWWFWNCLPPFILFVPVLLTIFFIYYFSFIFYQHHFLAPVNAEIINFINSSCDDSSSRTV